MSRAIASRYQPVLVALHWLLALSGYRPVELRTLNVRDGSVYRAEAT